MLTHATQSSIKKLEFSLYFCYLLWLTLLSTHIWEHIPTSILSMSLIQSVYNPFANGYFTHR